MFFILFSYFILISLTAAGSGDIYSVCTAVSSCKYPLGWVVLLRDTVH